MYTFFFDDSEFSIVSISNGKYLEDIQGHKHSKKSYELHYVMQGKGQLETDSNRFPLNADTLYITGPDIYHRQTFDREEPMYEFSIYIELVKESKGIFSQTFLEHTFWIGQGSDVIRELCLAIHSLDNNNTACSAIEMAALVQLLLCEIIKIYKPVFLQGEREVATRRIRLIEEAFMHKPQDLTLKCLADRMHLSQRQTERIIKENFGKTFSQLKRASQIEKSISYFEENIPLCEVAVLSGFCDSSAFFRAFKKEQGMTPSEYKLIHLK